MKIVTIKRTHPNTPDGTFGIIDIEGIPFCPTLELNWKNNQHDISHIPVGEYIANRIMSPKRGYEVYKLEGVPNRQDVEIHTGNSVHDILGCILLGRSIGVVSTKSYGEMLGLQESVYQFTRFMAALTNDKQIKLVIKEV